MSERLGGSSVPFRFHGECDPGGTEFTAGERKRVKSSLSMVFGSANYPTELLNTIPGSLY